MVPSSVVTGGASTVGGDSSGRSSTGMMFTGSIAPVMEPRKRRPAATGLADERLM